MLGSRLAKFGSISMTLASMAHGFMCFGAGTLEPFQDVFSWKDREREREILPVHMS